MAQNVHCHSGPREMFTSTLCIRECGAEVARLAAMVPFETSIERRKLAAAVERDFRALVELLSRDISGDDVPELVAMRVKAERGLKLAIKLVRKLDSNDSEPLA